MAREDIFTEFVSYAVNIFNRRAHKLFSKEFKRVWVGRIINFVTNSLADPYEFAILAEVTAKKRHSGEWIRQAKYVFEIRVAVVQTRQGDKYRAVLLGCFPWKPEYLRGQQGEEGKMREHAFQQLLDQTHAHALRAPPPRRSEALTTIRSAQSSASC